uniref:At4g15545-like C-terminal domain-containing protein n=1 Tax=Salix viminalis TaxID=40686 RepID=A0A6N2MYN4_SALVM
MMVSKESGGYAFDLPEDVLHVLPSDPFQQLDVARKITSIALSTRVSALESESSLLRAKLAEKEDFIAHLQSQIESLESSLADSTDELSQATQEKENLLKENASLSSTVKKLQRDVSKLEVFRKTLVQSLKEDDESSGDVDLVLWQAGAPHIIAKPTPNEDDTTLPPSRYSSLQSNIREMGNSFAEDRETDGMPQSISICYYIHLLHLNIFMAAPRPGISHILLASQTNTPRFTPPGSPPSFSASVSPTRMSKPVSPKRQSMSFSITRSMDDRSSAFSSQHSSMSSDAGSQSGRTRVDGKEFFRQVRTRLSYEQFGAFLANVKELNSHKQTKEETLRKAEEIFSPDNKDLYTIFEGLITRNVH